MKVALVRPTIGARDGKPYRSRAIMEPYIFALLAGLTPRDVEVQGFDERVADVPVLAGFDLAALTVDSYSARRGYELSRRIRGEGVPVVMGGFHPTLCPEEATAHADAVAVGEAEVLWPTIVDDARAGRLQPIYRADVRVRDCRVAPDRRVLTQRGYLPAPLVEFTRGCGASCDFCSVKRVYPGVPWTREVQDVVRDIEATGSRVVAFVDDNIVANPRAARELFLALRPLGIRWVSQASIALAQDQALLDLAVASGCVGLLIGLESLSDRSLASMHKTWAGGAEGYADALTLLKARGVLIFGSFIFGYDDDTPELFERTADFAIASKLFLAGFNPLQPYPGTPLYMRLAKDGRLLHPQWWLDDEGAWGRVAFQPARMTPAELEEGCAVARRRFNGAGSLLYRALDLRANLHDPFRAWLYLLGNLTSRQDLSRKATLPLGFASVGGRDSVRADDDEEVTACRD